MEVAGSAILILGAVCMIAAIIGGNVSLPGGTKFEALTSKLSRAVLASFAVILFVLGFILLVANLPSPPPPPGPPDDDDSRMQYTEAANEICRASTSAFSQVMEQEGRDGYEHGEMLDDALQIRQDQLSQLSDLYVPIDDETYIRSMEDSLNEHINALNSLIQNYEMEDEVAQEDSFVQMKVTASEFNQYANDYGLSDCNISAGL